MDVGNDDIKTDDLGVQTGNGTRNPFWLWCFFHTRKQQKIKYCTYLHHCYSSPLLERDVLSEFGMCGSDDREVVSVI